MGDCPHGLTANTFLVCCIVLLMYQWTTLSQVFCWMQSLYPGRGWTCVLNSSSESQLSTEAEESWIVFLNFLGFIWLLFFRFTVCNRHTESKITLTFLLSCLWGLGRYESIVWGGCVCLLECLLHGPTGKLFQGAHFLSLSPLRLLKWQVWNYVFRRVRYFPQGAREEGAIIVLRA